MNALTFENLVVIADIVCEHSGAHIRSYADLAAVATATGARLRGVPVHGGIDKQVQCLETQILRLAPLSEGANELLARVAGDVLRDIDAGSN